MSPDVKNTIHKLSLAELKQASYRMSRDIIEMTTKAGSGHPSSSLSAIDIMSALYLGGLMHYDPLLPHWLDRDRFILSKGHAAPALYAILAETGYFDHALLATLRQTGSPLEGHPNMRALPGVEATTGSLGEGLSIGMGHALAARIDGRDYHVWVLIGDGESDEGQIWETALAAAKYELSNLTVIVDNNQFQQTGPVKQVMPSLLPIAEKWRAMGWHVQEIDGHNMEQILQALSAAQAVRSQPQAIVAHTKKGKGLSPFEKDDVSRKHGVALKPDEAKIALAELDRMYGH